MKNNGIPEDQIIHLAYDDIANSSSNKFPGKIFNKPTAAGTPGVDVYEGCKIDYKGKEATAANLMAVLKGDAANASGPVLKSDENSKVFFYFADHGAVGLVAMPVGGYVYADKLNETFEFMHENKMFKEMTVYMEACESGSMFENILKPDLNIYAVSAANGRESSWGTYCSPDDKVDGKSIGTCLGDLFSVNWMEDTDAAKIDKETLQQQFSVVQKETTKSHVLQWGDVSFTDEPIANFESGHDVSKDPWKKLGQDIKFGLADSFGITEALSDQKNQFAVDSRDMKLHYLYHRVMEDPTHENHMALQDEISHRVKIDTIFKKTFGNHMDDMDNIGAPKDFECYRELINHFEENCE